MKKRLFIFLLIIFTIPLTTCKEEDSPTQSTSTSGDCPNGRAGAMCNDGTTSSATGSGACSSHGGVKYWICK
ncbi:MAG: hypothetical protein HYV29_01610 [Ignavibacteriales bacterium]|nr:hypothetical protein [Ignavibacteriales bacterium]